MTPLPLPSPLAPRVVEAVLVPLPNSPLWLSPQAQTNPSHLSARLLLAPPPRPSSQLPLTRAAAAGVALPLVPDPFPNSPCALFPQAHTEPSALSERLCEGK